MKKGLFLLVYLSFLSASAAPLCASKVSELKNIQNLLKKVDLFSTWEGTWDGAPLVAQIYQNTSGQLRGEVDHDGSKYGPANVKICDDNGLYYLVVYGQEVVFEVLSKKQIKGYSPFDENVTAILTVQEKDALDELL